MSLDSRLRELGAKGQLDPDPLDRALARLRRPLDREFERRATRLEDLAALGRSVDDELRGRRPDPGAPRVLVGSLRGWSSHNAYELLFAHALRLRGAEVALLTCGGGMPACELGRARRAFPRPCDRCAWLTDRVAATTDAQTFRLRDALPWGGDARSAPASGGAATPDDAEAARISTAWLLKATQTERVPGAAGVEEDFAVAVAGVHDATDSIIEEFRPDIVFLLNGLFAAERAIRDRALAAGLRAPTYEIAPRAGAVVLSQDSPAPDYDVDELWQTVAERDLTDSQRAEILALLDDRAEGVGAHESYYEHAESDHGELRRRLGLPPAGRVVSLFTNVTWDSATIGHDIGFGSMFDWVESAVRLAAGRELTLVVRIHPAESRWGTREEVGEVIGARIGELPANVRFIPSTQPLSSYALMDISDLLLTYTTTVGLEGATRGRTVAVAGDTHYRGRGFTLDVDGPEDLERALAAEAGPLDSERVERALRYAHMFFFRAMIPLPLLEASDGWVRRMPRDAEALAPGADPYLDWICDRILDGGHFGLPDVLAGAVPAYAG